MTFLLAVALWAQALQPFTGYTTADPISAGRLGLATPYGRYAITLSDGCAIGALQRVYVWPRPELGTGEIFVLAPINDDDAVVLSELSPDGEIIDRMCLALIAAKMDNTPCFGDGVCDVRYEIPE
jgi:hypothetical protein